MIYVIERDDFLDSARAVSSDDRLRAQSIFAHLIVQRLTRDPETFISPLQVALVAPKLLIDKLLLDMCHAVPKGGAVIPVRRAADSEIEAHGVPESRILQFANIARPAMLQQCRYDVSIDRRTRAHLGALRAFADKPMEKQRNVL